MIKKIVIAIVCIASVSMYAQDGSVSPYSYFGVGELRTTSTVENQMMGGLGVYADSIHVNLKNPAAYSQLGLSGNDKVGLTTYTAGISHNRITLKSFTAQEETAVTNLDYLALGFSLGKGLGVGFGIMPYSSVGYNIEQETSSSQGAINNVYSGISAGATVRVPLNKENNTSVNLHYAYRTTNPFDGTHNIGLIYAM